MSKTIVLSAIALQSGGTLSILQDCVRELSRPEYHTLTIYVILKDRTLAGSGVNAHIRFIEIDGTRSYVHRWYYEYVYFKKLSRQLKPDLWFSLHDITPNVDAVRRAVYCHNPSPFYYISWNEFFTDPKFGLFTVLYAILYRINIHRNLWVVVQQDWIRQKFSARFSVPKGKIIVAHPAVFFTPAKPTARAGDSVVFFYPSLPRVFKNIELIGEAVQLLYQQSIRNFEVILTIRGTENRYARKLRKKYGHLPALRWKGLVSREEVFRLYGTADCLIFPSKLETWGLPVSEFRQTGKPILLADKPYAHETAGNYGPVRFFDPEKKEELAREMQGIISGVPVEAIPGKLPVVPAPMADGWESLFRIMLAF